MSRLALVLALALVSSGICGAARAQTQGGAVGAQCDRKAYDRSPGVFSLRADNDVISHQDQGYTSGLQLIWTTPRLASYQDPCLSDFSRALNRLTGWLQPDGDERRMTYWVDQSLYTPTSHQAALAPNDRPYAATLMFGVAYTARATDREQRGNSLQIGMVGPMVHGKSIQDMVHRLIRAPEFMGWDHQLRNEPLLQWSHQRAWRLLRGENGSQATGSRGFDGLRAVEWDLIGRAGLTLGNLLTQATVGGEFRLGNSLPDDFGTSPLHAQVMGTATNRNAFTDGRWRVHGFLSADARLVARDLTLDGNTFEHSHHVDHRWLVTELGFGAGITQGRWNATLGIYFRSREFDGQQQKPHFGSLVVSRTF